MRFSCVSVLFLGLLFLIEPALAGAPDNTSPERQFKLPNGLTVLLVRDTRFPLVSTRLFVHTGSANERPEQAGISHVLEHMVFKGTAKRPRGKVAEEVESLGGYLNAATSFDRTWYITDIPKEHWKTGIDVVRDMAFDAILAPEELEPEKDVIVSELKRGDDSPDHRLYEDLQKAALVNSPYGHPIIGFEPTIRAVTSESLKAYRNFWYEPQNMALLVAGDFDLNEVEGYVREHFGGRTNTRILPEEESVSLENAPGKDVVSVRRGPWQKVYLGLAFPAPSLKDLASADLDLVSYVLGGDATSFFARRYKYEQELVDAISVDNMSLGRAGLLTLTAELDASKVEAFFEALTKDLAGIAKESFPLDAIERGVRTIEESMNRAGETLTGLASWKATVAFMLGGETGEANMRARLEQATPELLLASFRRWFDPKHMRIRVLAPEKATLPDFLAIAQKNWTQNLANQASAPSFASKVEHIDLPGGSRVVLLPDTHAPYFSLNMASFGGNALLQKSEEGLANLTARTLTDGAGPLTREAFEKALADKALSLSVESGRQSFTLALTGPSRFADTGLDLALLALEKPNFADAEIAREGRLMRAQLKQLRDEPLLYLFTKIRPFLYGNHVYGYADLGTEESLARFGRKDVLAFWEKQRRFPFVLTCTGSFEREKILAFAEKLAKERTAKAETVPTPVLTKEQTLTLTGGQAQSHLLAIFPAVPMDHPDAPALLLLSRILSGQSGLLFSSMRDEEGLGYTVTAFLRSLPKSGTFFFYIGTEKAKLERAKEAFTRIIGELSKKPVPEALLVKGVNQLRGDYIRSNQSLNARASETTKNLLLGYPEAFKLELIEKAAKLTPEDLRACARKYLTEASARWVTLAP